MKRPGRREASYRRSLNLSQKGDLMFRRLANEWRKLRGRPDTERVVEEIERLRDRPDTERVVEEGKKLRDRPDTERVVEEVDKLRPDQG